MTEEVKPVEAENKKEEVIQPEKKEDTKERDEKKIRGKMFRRRIFNIFFWILVLGLFAIWVTDFIMVKTEKEPLFCIKEETHTFDDGTVEECLGLGYKIYTYKRTSLNAVEFGPFFISMRD